MFTLENKVIDFLASTDCLASWLQQGQIPAFVVSESQNFAGGPTVGIIPPGLINFISLEFCTLE